MTEDEVKMAENEKKRQDLARAYKRLFATDDGKRVLADLEKFCGLYTTSVCEQHPNALQTFFAEGRRRVFLRIQGFLRRKTDE